MSTPSHVWYAAYGSNLSAERFGYYISGGSPDGAARTYEGCREYQPPTGDRPAVLAHRLYFAGASRNWGGAVAFIDPDRDAEQRTLARLYRLSWSQLEDVIAQENGGARGSVHLGDDVLREGTVEIEGGWYSVVVHVTHEWGEPLLVDGEHAVTVTARAGRLDYEAPTIAYLRHVVRGLRDSHGLTDDRILDYLLYRSGIEGRLSREQLNEALRERP